jgi:hypothetical protein
MSDIKTNDGMTVEGRITTRVWDVEQVEHADPEWSDRSKEEKHELLCDPSDYPTAPISEGETTNIPVDGYLEALAEGDNPEPSHLAIGDDDSQPSSSNEELNNEVYRTIVGEDEADGRDRITSTFLGQDEANGNTLKEVGFVDGSEGDDWLLLTHAALDTGDQVDKTSNIMVTYNYTLSWRRVD